MPRHRSYKLLLLLTALAAVPACRPSADPATPAGDQSLALADIPAGAAAADAAALTPVGMYADLRGYSGIRTRERAVVRDGDAWRALWRRAANGVDAAAAPAVDFASDLVIFAALGERPGGGHYIEVERVYRHGDDLYAVVSEHAPGPRCMTPQPLSMQPIVAVRVAGARGLRARFVERAVVDGCD